MICRNTSSIVKLANGTYFHRSFFSRDRFLVDVTDPQYLYAVLDTRAAERLGAKTSVMNLMSHQNPDVKYWALVSVQQLISQPWAV